MNGITRLPVGRKDGHISVGEERVLRGKDTEPTIMFDCHSSCADLTVEQAQAIIDALKSAIDWVPPVPDIALPVVDNAPAASAVTIDGQTLVLCNWLNFKGWEVRRKTFYSGQSDREVGWVRPGDLGFIAVDRDGTETRCDRVDVALRYLLTR